MEPCTSSVADPDEESLGDNVDDDSSLRNSLSIAEPTMEIDQDSTCNSVASEPCSSKNGKLYHSVKSKNITLDRLIRDGVLEPASACLSVKYLGKTLTADLLEDGKIRATETGELFNTPSAWAIYCKRSINPAKTSGCGWSSIRYKGKSLDNYKTKWLSEVADGTSYLPIKTPVKRNVTKRPSKKEIGFDLSIPVDQNIVDPIDAIYPCMSQLPLSDYNKNVPTQVRCEGLDVSLKAVFNQTACLKMAEISLSSSEEISGYLSGSYDSLHNVLHVVDVYGKADGDARQKVYSSGRKLVGWFHSHPTTSYHPTVYDVECHLNYQLRFRDQPLVACIIGEKHAEKAPGLSMLCYTVAPPKLKFSERFGCLSDKCGKPKNVQWTLEPDMPPSASTTCRVELQNFLDNLTDLCT